MTRRIITPALDADQPVFEVLKDLNGGMAIRVHDKAVHLSPRQSYDLAIVLLQSIGAVFTEMPRLPDSLMGDPLKARMKLQFAP